jgi:hypothetical protein
MISGRLYTSIVFNNITDNINNYKNILEDIINFTKFYNIDELFFRFKQLSENEQIRLIQDVYNNKPKIQTLLLIILFTVYFDLYDKLDKNKKILMAKIGLIRHERYIPKNYDVNIELPITSLFSIEKLEQNDSSYKINSKLKIRTLEKIANNSNLYNIEPKNELKSDSLDDFNNLDIENENIVKIDDLGSEKLFKIKYLFELIDYFNPIDIYDFTNKTTQSNSITSDNIKYFVETMYNILNNNPISYFCNLQLPDIHITKIYSLLTDNKYINLMDVKYNYKNAYTIENYQSIGDLLYFRGNFETYKLSSITKYQDTNLYKYTNEFMDILLTLDPNAKNIITNKLITKNISNIYTLNSMLKTEFDNLILYHINTEFHILINKLFIKYRDLDTIFNK